MTETDRKSRWLQGRGSGPRAADKGRRRRRLPWRELLLAGAATALFFGLLEVALSLAGLEPVVQREDPLVGFAGNVPLFAPATGADGRPMLATAPGRLDLFNPQSFPRQKAVDAFRIFCLGGSTTYGRPYDDSTSFAGWLRELLAIADPTRRWQVVNAGGVSFASYRVARLMTELRALEPDLFIVYTGHNEFLEERTYSKLRNLPLPIRALSATLARTRTWAAAHSLLRRVGALPERSRETRHILPQEVDAKLDHAAGLDLYERDDGLRFQIVEHYRVSLERIVAIARGAGASLLFVTPASSLRSCSPFKSQHTEGLGRRERLRSKSLLATARSRLRALDGAGALGALEEALAFDPRFAELHFLRGRILFEAGRYAQADAALRRARDEDVCPLRATSDLLTVLRRVAEETGTPVVDFEKLLQKDLKATRSHVILGEEDFMDHVHPTIEAHRRLALALIESMVRLRIVPPTARPSEGEIAAVAARIEGSVDPEKQAWALAALALTLEWAGKMEESRRLAFRALQSGVEHPRILLIAGKHIALDGDLGTARALYLRAARADPLSPTPRYRMGLLAIRSGELEEAAANFFLATALWPEGGRAREKLALVMAERGRYDLALASLREARRRDPGRESIQRAIAKIQRLAGRRTPEVDAPALVVKRYASGLPRIVAQTTVDAAGRAVYHGIHTEWHENGVLRRFVDYERGTPRGTPKTWDESGRVRGGALAGRGPRLEGG